MAEKDLKFLDGLDRSEYQLKKDTELNSEFNEFKFQVIGKKKNISVISHALLKYFKSKKYNFGEKIKNENDQEKDITLKIQGEYEVDLKIGTSKIKDLSAIQLRIPIKNKPISYFLGKELSSIFYENDFKKVYEYLKAFWKEPKKED